VSLLAANGAGEFAAVCHGECGGIDVGTGLGFGKRAVALDESFVVSQLVGVAGQEHVVAVAKPAGFDAVDVFDEVGGAVVGDGVVELGMDSELVGPTEDIKEQSPSIVGRGGGAVEIDIFTTVICAELDHIALIGEDVHELVLAEAAFPGSVGLAFFLADFDADGEVLRRLVGWGEFEAKHRVGETGHIVERDHEEIDAREMVEIVDAVFVVEHKVLVIKVAAVSDVTHKDPVAMEFGSGYECLVGLPIAQVGRRGHLCHALATDSNSEQQYQCHNAHSTLGKGTSL